MAGGPRRVIVVGAGITGLSAGYRILSGARGAAVLTLIEQRSRLGGNIQTERQGGFVIDGGPDAFIVAKPQGTALCKELGLADRLIETTEQNRRVYVQRHGRLHPLPEGIVLTVPTRILPFVRTPLVSWTGKARVALDLMLPPRASELDESLGHFVRRRLGKEVLEAIAEPLLGGIYAGDVHALSVRSTFPQLVELERKHGSLIRGAIIAQRAKVSMAGGKPPSVFHSLLGGLGELIESLTGRLSKGGADVRLGTSIVSISASEAALARPAPRFTVHVVDASGARDSVPADDVVLAVPAFAAAPAVEGIDEELARMLRRIPYLSTATIVLAYERADVAHPLDASGVILPASEHRRILAVTFISSKWASRAPPSSVLLRVFVGGHRDPGALAQNDEALIAIAKDELAAVLGIRARPILARVFRFERSNPQPIVGHADRVRAMRARVARVPGLHLAGAAFDGVGIPDCIRQAEEVASDILRSMGL